MRQTVADHIPIINSEDAVSLVKKNFRDSAMVRVPVIRAKLLPSLDRAKVWIDPCVDGFDDIDGRNNEWSAFIKTLPNFERLAQAPFLKKPIQSDVDVFVNDVMNKCAMYKPAWITIPQFPTSQGSDRNKINRSLASAAGKWKSSTSYAGRLILPLVFTHQEQINCKTSRNPKVQLAERCFQDAQADGLWVVDSSLTDDNGSATLQQKRFPGVISLHEELNDRITSGVRFGGPYWGLNLVLWAKGLIDHPVIGVGSGFQFFLSGGFYTTPNAKIAIPSLRRRVVVSPSLGPWFEQSIAKLGASHPVHDEFVGLKKRLEFLSQPARAREQVATFYKQWFDRVANVPKGGRSMALFQDLSAAYALGKSLPPLPDEKAARRPESVAEPLMLSCL